MIWKLKHHTHLKSWKTSFNTLEIVLLSVCVLYTSLIVLDTGKCELALWKRNKSGVYISLSNARWPKCMAIGICNKCNFLAVDTSVTCFIFAVVSCRLSFRLTPTTTTHVCILVAYWWSEQVFVFGCFCFCLCFFFFNIIRQYLRGEMWLHTCSFEWCVWFCGLDLLLPSNVHICMYVDWMTFF